MYKDVKFEIIWCLEVELQNRLLVLNRALMYLLCFTTGLGKKKTYFQKRCFDFYPKENSISMAKNIK